MNRLRRGLRSAYRAAAATTRGRAALTGFAAVAALHLAWQFVDEDGLVSSASQILLMPALAAVLLAGRPSRTRLSDLTLIALGASWLGDSVPRFLADEPGFLAMVGCFLVAQVSYIAGFLPYRADSTPWTQWRARLPYVVAFAGLVGWCLPGAGALAPPVVGYGAALTIMALLSPGLSTLAGVGGAVFMASDGLIALHAFAGVSLPVHDFWVMLTYLLGQGCIVAAVINHDLEHDQEHDQDSPIGLPLNVIRRS